LNIDQPIVRYKQVSKSFGDLKVLKELDLDIAPAEKVALIGPSGSGKTTLLKNLCRLLKPLSGNIVLEKDDIKNFIF